MNALGVLAAVEALGGDLGLAAVALGRWQPPEGRGERWTVLLGPGGLDGAITLIDESYNANPAAMAAAFEVFAAAEPADGVGRVARGRRIAFLGDMLELGPEERALHAGLAAVPALGRAHHRPLRRRADARAARGAAARAAAASGSRPPPRWRRGCGGCSTPATSPWSRARAAPASTSSSRRSRRMGEARPGGGGRRVGPMLYYLAELSQNLSALNVFRYITFRAGGAFFTALRLRLPVRPPADRAPARAPGPRPADPQRRPRGPPDHQGRHPDHGRPPDPLGDRRLDAALGALVERLRLDGALRHARLRADRLRRRLRQGAQADPRRRLGPGPPARRLRDRARRLGLGDVAASRRR